MFEPSPTHRRSTWIRRAVAVGAAVVVIGGAAVVVHANDDTSAGFRTAVAGTGDVDHGYSGVATIEPVTQATVAFPTSGTVSSVDVLVGDLVEIGQQLATLDTIELERELRSKQATLAQAQLVLSVALDGDDPSSLVQGSAQGPVGFASVVTTSSERAATAAFASTAVAAADVNDEVSAAQQAVLAAQQAVDAATADAQSAMGSAVSLCSAVGTATDPMAAITACQGALDAVVAAQQAVSDAQAGVTAAATTLDGLLATWSSELAASSTSSTAAPEPTPTTSTPAGPETTPSTTAPGSTGEPNIPTGQGGATGRATGSAPSSGGSVTTKTPTAADLIAYQYSVDAAQYAVEAAEQALAQATIVSPISGTVTEVNLAAGDDVTAASDTGTIVIEGSGGFEATTTVSINDVADFEVGQAATVIADGSGTALTGNVVAIASTPESSSTSYRVTVGLDDPTQQAAGLHNGNIGTVSIVTETATAVVTVPTSAIRLVGTQHIVTVVDDDGTATATRVTIGAVGSAETEITSGVEAGDVVVLADLDG